MQSNNQGENTHHCVSSAPHLSIEADSIDGGIYKHSVVDGAVGVRHKSAVVAGAVSGLLLLLLDVSGHLQPTH